MESEPSGARVVLSTGERGVIPVTFTKKRTESFLVTVSKDGYAPQSVAVESKFSPSGGGVTLGNAILGGVVGVVVDGATGAMKGLYPNPVFVNLATPSQTTRAARNTTTTRTSSRTSSSRSKPAPPSRFRTDKYGTQYLDPDR